MKLFYTNLILLLITSVVSGKAFTLSPEQIESIGMQIWKNECQGTVDGLTSWNKGEEFASLGIGHFIWYPEGHSGPYKETFPELLQFLKSQETEITEWLQNSKGSPWKSYNEFQDAKFSPQMISLRDLLFRTINLQIIFILQRTDKALQIILASVPEEKQKEIQHKFSLLTNSSRGTYAVIDYINFKGEGTSIQERYNNQGWGLLQVLEMMPQNVTQDSVVDEFIMAAKRVLKQRVQNSPKERNEERWLKGWFNRLDTYTSVFKGV